MDDQTCPTCGSDVEVVGDEDGTRFYRPDRPDLEHVGYRVRFADGHPWIYDESVHPVSNIEFEELAERGWQVERLYRRKEGEDG